MSDECVRVYKIGGNVIDDPPALTCFLQEFAALPGRKILVHGGGKEATRLGRRLGIEATMIDGRRVTDAAMLDVVMMTYAGLINKRIVAGLQAVGCNAIGLSGADGGSIKATRRSPKPVDFGYVGDIAAGDVNSRGIMSLINAGFVPVFCAIMHDGVGTLLNCNADSVAAAIATGMSGIAPVELIYCFEKEGVLRNPDDETSVIKEITPDTFDTLKAEGVIHSGMIPKVQNAINAVRAGVRSVVIRTSRDIPTPHGTVIRQG